MAIGIVAIFLVNPKENNMIAMKRILRYLKGKKYYSDRFELKVFIDSNWDGNIDDGKITSGGVFFLGKRLVSWTR